MVSVHAVGFGSNTAYELLASRVLEEFYDHHKHTFSCIKRCVYGLCNLPEWVLHLPDATRGYKYWIWKPVIALAAMQDMADGDILYYTDGRSCIHGHMSWLTEFVASGADIGVLHLEPERVEQIWTRGDLMAEFAVPLDSAHALSPQFMATTWAVRKNATSLAFIEKWQNFMRTHYELCSFGSSTLPNAAGFCENRNDQSVWSLLVKTDSDVTMYSTPFSNAHTYVPHAYAHPTV